MMLPVMYQPTVSGTMYRPTLHEACADGDVALAYALLMEGADVNALGEHGSTALHCTALLDCPMAAYTPGTCPMAAHAAVAAAWFSTAATQNLLQRHAECARLLLCWGADMEVQNGDDVTPLQMACRCGHLPVVQLLCINGASRSPNWRGSPEESEKDSCYPGWPAVLAWLQHTRGCTSPLHYLTAPPARMPSALHVLPLQPDLRSYYSLLQPRLDLLDVAAVRALLRGGAALSLDHLLLTATDSAHLAILAAPQDRDSTTYYSSDLDYDVPSPLELAQQRLSASPGDDAAQEAMALIEDAAAPWSPTTHALWPAAGRQRACVLVRLGRLLAYSDAPPGPFRNPVSLMDAWRDFVMPLALVRGDYELGAADALHVPTWAEMAAYAAARVAPRLL